MDSTEYWRSNVTNHYASRSWKALLEAVLDLFAVGGVVVTDLPVICKRTFKNNSNEENHVPASMMCVDATPMQQAVANNDYRTTITSSRIQGTNPSRRKILVEHCLRASDIQELRAEVSNIVRSIPSAVVEAAQFNPDCNQFDDKNIQH